MTSISPRVTLGRVSLPNPFAPLARRWAARKALARPPAYLVVCATVGVLNIVGLVMVLSASSVEALSSYGSAWYFFERQLWWAACGLVAFVVAARVDYRRWKRFAASILGASIVLMMMVPFIGEEVYGAKRWIGVGSFGIQPSELAKLGLLLCGAHILSRRGAKVQERSTWLPVVVILVVLAALVMVGRDLTSTVVLGLIGAALLVVAGVANRDLFRLGLYALAGTVALAILEPYRRARLLGFLHPSHDPSNATYQIRQSLIAVGSGGLNGVGLGAGRAKWQFLPNAHTDFIFAIIGEELGFVGCLLVLGLFAGFGLVGLHVARRTTDRFGMLLAAGITAWIVGQAAINLGAVVGVLPVSGVTLPFLSVGGSSLVITMFAAGILANVARQTVPAEARPRARGKVRAGAARS